MKYIPKRLIDFLGINVYVLNGKMGYDRLYESVTMDILEYIYDIFANIYTFIKTIVYKIAFAISFIMFSIIPTPGNLTPRELAEKLTTGIIKNKQTKKEEYEEQFQEIVDEAVDASVINAELMAMNDEERIAYFIKENKTIKELYEAQDKERDDWVQKYYVEYPTFKIHLRRKGYYQFYRIVSVTSKTTEGITDYVITLGNSKTETTYATLFEDVIKELIPEHKELATSIDENLVLPIPKLKFALNEYIEYTGIPDRSKPKIRNLEEEYAPLLGLIEAFNVVKKEDEKKQSEVLEQMKETIKNYKAK